MATFNLNSVDQGLSGIASALNGANPITQAQQQSFEANGFLLGSTPSASGSGLPFTTIAPYVPAQIQRNIITWFVPQFGTVQMFINPQNITYNYKKLINKDRTKNGYTLQYWGEDLSVLNISGTTGSSGVEGINALYEIYRAEQYAFDAVGLVMAANNAAADVANTFSQGIGGAIGQLIGGTNFTSGANNPSLLGGIVGIDTPDNSLSARNIPTLASLAFGVEMYYNGWVYRGFFENMTVTERADNFLIDYQMTFTVTQRRGYRTNYFPWSNSPAGGMSAEQPFYPNPSSSFSGQTIVNTNQGVNVNNTVSGTGVVNEILNSIL